MQRVGSEHPEDLCPIFSEVVGSMCSDVTS